MPAVPLMVIGIWWICLRMLKLSLDSMASAVLGHINRALALTLGSAFAFLLVHYVSIMMSDSMILHARAVVHVRVR